MSRAPYKHFDYYTSADADLFFGREKETQMMVGEILSSRLLVLFAASGSGKTSLINAGVVPELKRLGYETLYVRFENDPLTSLQNAAREQLQYSGTANDLHGLLQNLSAGLKKPFVVFLDQFEEFFLVFADQPALRQDFIAQIAAVKYDDQLPVFLVLSLREDYYANLHEFRSAIPSIFQNNANIRLGAFSDEEARRAILKPLATVGLQMEIGLAERIIRDLEQSEKGRKVGEADSAGIEPITLQIVCHKLWQMKPKGADIITATVYEKCGGAQKILRNHISELLEKIPQRQQGFMVRIFEALKTRDNTKLYRRVQDLQETLRLRDERRLKGSLQKLTDMGVLRHEQRSSDDWYEFKHDYLVPEVTKWVQARRERINRRRVLYGIIPGAVLLFSILTYIFYQYNTFYLGFVNAEYPHQSDEIAIFRQLDPLHPVITTGFLDKEYSNYSNENSIMRSHVARKDLKEHYKMGFWQSANWKPLEQKLNSAQSGFYLYKIGREGAGIDSLIAVLKDKDPEACSQAAAALASIGRIDEEGISALVTALKNDYSRTPSPVMEALVELGKRDERVLAVLVAALAHENQEIRLNAAWVLVRLDQNNNLILEAFLNYLKDDNLDMNYPTFWALRRLGKSDERIITALLNVLQDKEHPWYVRSQVLETLAELGQRDERVIHRILVMFNEERNVYVRSGITSVLGELGNSDDRILEALMIACRDEDYRVRSNAASALGELGELDERAVDMLLALLKDADWRIRLQALTPMSELGKSDERVLVALLAALEDSDWRVRSRAAIALVKLGQSDERVLTSLLAVFKDEFSKVGSQAVGMVRKLGQSSERIIDELKEINSDVRSEAATTLGEFGQRGEQIIITLMTALKDENSNVRANAIWALQELSQSDEPVVTELVAALRDDESNVRSQALWALEKIGKKDEQIITALQAVLKDDDSYVRSAAAEALGKLLQSESEDDLMKLISHKLSCYRITGAQALAKKDSLSKQTLDEIDRLRTEDERPWVKLGAWYAHQLIQEKIESEKEMKKENEKAKQHVQKADSLFDVGLFAEARTKYESAFYGIRDLTRSDSLNSAYAKFQQARCGTKLKRKIVALNALKTAFEYNPALRDTLRTEMSRPENDWKILEGNWYLRDVLLKKE